MNQRSVPWVSKIPSGFAELIEASKELKLFLVGQIGPTIFTFKDENGDRFKIQIGFEVSCSCNLLKINQHCIHTLFVLLKKFRVSPEVPIIWQGSYTGQETEDIINMKFSTDRRASQVNQRTNFLHARQGTKKITNQMKNAQKQNRQPIESDAVCPICQEDMHPEEALTYCRRKCGNNFHIKCLRVWIEHKQISNDEKMSCPMCRTDMTRSIIEEMRRDEDEYNIKYVSHVGHNCSGCNKKNIVGNLYHCLLCENYDLCHRCYNDMSVSHTHGQFLLKKLKSSPWQQPPCRPQFSNSSLPGIQLPSLRTRVIFNSKDQQPQEYLGGEKDLVEYLVNCFPFIKDAQQEIQLFNGLSIIGQEMNKSRAVCVACKVNDVCGKMRKLNCTHAVDTLCLRKMFKEDDGRGQVQCPACQVPLLKGYGSSVISEESEQSLKNTTKLSKNALTLSKQTKGKISTTTSKAGGTTAQVSQNNSNANTIPEDMTLTGNLLLRPTFQPLQLQGEQVMQPPDSKKNFRIKKGIPSKNQKMLLTKEINQRVLEQKENLQSLLQIQQQQQFLQLAGREMLKKQQNNRNDKGKDSAGRGGGGRVLEVMEEEEEEEEKEGFMKNEEMYDDEENYREIQDEEFAVRAQRNNRDYEDSSLNELAEEDRQHQEYQIPDDDMRRLESQIDRPLDNNSNINNYDYQLHSKQLEKENTGDQEDNEGTHSANNFSYNNGRQCEEEINVNPQSRQEEEEEEEEHKWLDNDTESPYDVPDQQEATCFYQMENQAQQNSNQTKVFQGLDQQYQQHNQLPSEELYNFMSSSSENTLAEEQSNKRNLNIPRKNLALPNQALKKVDSQKFEKKQPASSKYQKQPSQTSSSSSNRNIPSSAVEIPFAEGISLQETIRGTSISTTSSLRSSTQSYRASSSDGRKKIPNSKLQQHSTATAGAPKPPIVPQQNQPIRQQGSNSFIKKQKNLGTAVQGQTLRLDV